MSSLIDLRVYVEVPTDVDIHAAVELFDKDSTFQWFKVDVSEPDRACHFEMPYETGNTFDTEMKELQAWCKEHLHAGLKGYWIEDTESMRIRSEFKEDEIVSENTEWVLDYTVDQITALHKYAEETYGKP